MARSNRRKFVWARTGAVLTNAAGGDNGFDLLADFKGRAGGSVLLGATLVTVRGVLRPNVSGGEFVGGTFGIRVCNEGDITAATAGNGQRPEENPEADWLAFMPFIVPGSGDNAGNPPATWNEMASPWACEIKAQRKMEELGETVGLFWDGSDAITTIDVSLSLGLKLA